jgi:outer membrane protein OmpA-like peptidoglycan-associated protein
MSSNLLQNDSTMTSSAPTCSTAGQRVFRSGRLAVAQVVVALLTLAPTVARADDGWRQLLLSRALAVSNDASAQDGVIRQSIIGVTTLEVTPPPPTSTVRVELSGDRIRTSAPLAFSVGSDEVLPQSVAVLDEVAQTLSARPSLRRVRIEVRAEARGPVGRRQALSQRRAEKVRDALVQRGVNPARLDLDGQGAGAASVEFVVVQ